MLGGDHSEAVLSPSSPESVLVLAQAAETKHHGLGGLNNRNFPLFWRLGLQHPGFR